MKKIILIFSITFLISCNSNTETIKGDLSFKLVNIISPNGMSELEVKQFKLTINNYETNKVSDLNEKKFFTYLKKLDEQNLLGLPYISIKQADGETKQVFISTEEYKKIKNFTFDYLKTNRKKVSLELEITPKDSILYSDNITSIRESDGETFFSK